MVSANFLQMTAVRDKCSAFLTDRLHPSNVFGIRELADTLSCSALFKAADRYVNEYFRDIVETEEFLSLALTDVLVILPRDELHIASEDQVFEAVMRWVKHEPTVRGKHLPQLLTAVRMPLMTPQFLADLESVDDHLLNSLQCQELIAEARNYQQIPESRPQNLRFVTRPRYFNVMGDIYVFAYGTDALDFMQVFHPLKGQWRRGEVMSEFRTRAGVGAIRNFLYVCGGLDQSVELSTVERFDPQERKWSPVAPMHQNRSGIGVAALDDKLYVCGGRSVGRVLNTVECYDPDKEVWTVLPSMTEHRYELCVVACQGFIYALGGRGVTGDGLHSVERYDPVLGTWTYVAPMLTKRRYHGAAALHGKIYVCGGLSGDDDKLGHQTVEIYDPRTKAWQFVAPMNQRRSGLAVVANMGKLWAFTSDYNSNVEVYDPGTNSWSLGASLCRKIKSSVVAAAVIPFC